MRCSEEPRDVRRHAAIVGPASTSGSTRRRPSVPDVWSAWSRGSRSRSWWRCGRGCRTGRGGPADGASVREPGCRSGAHALSPCSGEVGGGDRRARRSGADQLVGAPQDGRRQERCGSTSALLRIRNVTVSPASRVTSASSTTARGVHLVGEHGDVPLQRAGRHVDGVAVVGPLGPRLEAGGRERKVLVLGEEPQGPVSPAPSTTSTSSRRRLPAWPARSAARASWWRGRRRRAVSDSLASTAPVEARAGHGQAAGPRLVGVVDRDHGQGRRPGAGR